MHRSGRPTALAALILLIAGSAAVPAWADERTEARRHFEAGMDHIRAGRYLPGIAELEHANAILPHPSVRYNIARAFADAGLVDEAVAAYRSYIARDPEDRATAASELRALEALLAVDKEGANASPTSGCKNEPPRSDEPHPRPPSSAPTSAGSERSAPRDDVYREEVVTASRRAQSTLDAPNSTTIITRQDIHLSGINRIPELLRRVAGMDVAQLTGGDTSVSMRGLNSRLSNKLLVLVNGNIVKNDLLGSTFWESLGVDVDQIERIEVVRGPGSSLYGADAFSGVVNIITVAPGEGSNGARIGVGDSGEGYGSAWASRRKGDVAFRISSGYTRRPRWTREVTDGRSDVNVSDADPNLGSENVRFDLRTSVRLGKERSVELGGGFARSSLDIYGIGPFNDYAVRADLVDTAVAFRSRHLTTRARYSYLGAHAQQNHAYLGHSLYAATPRQQNLDLNLELSNSFDQSREFSQNVIGGVGYRLKKVDWSYLSRDTPIEHHVGLFVQDAAKFGERVGLTASGRLDWVPALGRIVPSARATFLAAPDAARRQALKASFATAFRSPTFLEAYLDLPIQLQLSGIEIQSSSRRDDNPSFRLAPERILAVEFEYQNQASDAFELDIAAYFHRISDRIQLASIRRSTLTELAGGVGGLNEETGRYRVGSGGWENSCGVDHVLGGEVGGRFVGVEGLDLFANYALNVGLHEPRFDCSDLSDQRTSQHKVNLGAQVRTGSGFNGEVTFHYQTSQLWSEQVATSTDVETQLFPLPGYHLLNARLGYAFLAERRAEVSAVVWNALADVLDPAPQMHPFGNRVGRRVMAFFSFKL